MIRQPEKVMPGMFSNDMDTDWEDPEVLWREELQSYRMHLVDCICYNKVCAALISYQVIDSEDHEELSNQVALRTEKMRINRLIDILQRKEEASYTKFLDVLGLYYPQVYTEITHKEPPPPKTGFFDSNQTHSQQELAQLLMQALDRMTHENFELSKKYKRCTKALDDREQECDRYKKKVDDLTVRVERYDDVDNEIATLRQEVDRLKNENYSVCMRIIDANEENAKLREANIRLRNDNDKVKVDLQKLENCVALERNQSVRLRNRLQDSPSERDVMEMKREIDALKLKLAQASHQVFREGDLDMRIQILKRDKDEAIEMYAGAVETLSKLREDCANAEIARDKYLEEKEQLNLTVSTLEGDIDMYKKRRDIAWQQLQEVEKEREMVMKERNESQSFAKACMQEKTLYRQQIRQLEEKYDQQTQKLLETERKLLSLARARQASEGYDWSSYPPAQPNSVSTSTASSSPTADRNQSDASSEFEARPRVFNTKKYEQYIKSPCRLNSEENRKNKIFPEIPIAANYGPNDSVLNSTANSPRRFTSENEKPSSDNALTTKEIKRVYAQRKKRNRPSINSTCSKQLSCDSSGSSANSNDDSSALPVAIAESLSNLSIPGKAS